MIKTSENIINKIIILRGEDLYTAEEIGKQCRVSVSVVYRYIKEGYGSYGCGVKRKNKSESRHREIIDFVVDTIHRHNRPIHTKRIRSEIELSVPQLLKNKREQYLVEVLKGEAGKRIQRVKNGVYTVDGVHGAEIKNYAKKFNPFDNIFINVDDNGNVREQSLEEKTKIDDAFEREGFKKNTAIMEKASAMILSGKYSFNYIAQELDVAPATIAKLFSMLEERHINGHGKGLRCACGKPMLHSKFCKAKKSRRNESDLKDDIYKQCVPYLMAGYSINHITKILNLNHSTVRLRLAVLEKEKGKRLSCPCGLKFTDHKGSGCEYRRRLIGGRKFFGLGIVRQGDRWYINLRHFKEPIVRGGFFCFGKAFNARKIAIENINNSKSYAK